MRPSIAFLAVHHSATLQCGSIGLQLAHTKAMTEHRRSFVASLEVAGAISCFQHVCFLAMKVAFQLIFRAACRL